MIIPQAATTASSHEQPHAPSTVSGGREYSGGRNFDKKHPQVKKASKFARAENAILERFRVDTVKERIAVGQSSLGPTRGSSTRQHRGTPYPEVRYGNKTLDFRRDASFTEYRQAPDPVSASTAQSSVRVPTEIGSVAGSTPQQQLLPIHDSDVSMGKRILVILVIITLMMCFANALSPVVANDTSIPQSIEDRLESINLRSQAPETQTPLQESDLQAKSGRANVRNTITIKPSTSKTRSAGKSATAVPDAPGA